MWRVVKLVPQLELASFLIRFTHLEDLSSTILRWGPKVRFRERYAKQARSQLVFSGKPEGPFCLSCTFIFRNERNWMQKSASVSENLVSPGLPGLQVATRLPRYTALGSKFTVLPMYRMRSSQSLLASLLAR